MRLDDTKLAVRFRRPKGGDGAVGVSTNRSIRLLRAVRPRSEMVFDANEGGQMKRRYLFGLGLLSATVVVAASLPAFAGTGAQRAASNNPLLSVRWSNGPVAPFDGTRFGGAFVKSLNRVYFLGFRTDNDLTDGSVWYLDTTNSTYTDTTVDMPIPISNYAPVQLVDSHGPGIYTFGGRTATGQIIKSVQVYYPADNMAKIINTDPYPGTTPSACIALPAMGAIGLGNKAYVLGGMSFSTSVPACVDDNSAQTWIFDPMAPAGSRWTAGPDLNVARGYITPAVLNGRIYAIGGDENSVGTLFAQVTVEAWKPGTIGWNDAAVADLPEACDESAAFALAGGPIPPSIVLASCGQWPNGNGDTNVYDATSNTWALSGQIHTVVRNEAGTVIKLGTKNKMYILGGYIAPNFTTPTNISEVGSAGAARADAALHGRAVRTSTVKVPNN